MEAVQKIDYCWCMKTKSDKAIPQDYPVMAFRIEQTEKDTLTELIAEVVEHSNKKRSKGTKKVKKNDVIVEALKIGLNQMLKK